MGETEVSCRAQQKSSGRIHHQNLFLANLKLKSCYKSILLHFCMVETRKTVQGRAGERRGVQLPDPLPRRQGRSAAASPPTGRTNHVSPNLTRPPGIPRCDMSRGGRHRTGATFRRLDWSLPASESPPQHADQFEKGNREESVWFSFAFCSGSHVSLMDEITLEMSDVCLLKFA